MNRTWTSEIDDMERYQQVILFTDGEATVVKNFDNGWWYFRQNGKTIALVEEWMTLWEAFSWLKSEADLQKLGLQYSGEIAVRVCSNFSKHELVVSSGNVNSDASSGDSDDRWIISADKALELKLKLGLQEEELVYDARVRRNAISE